jgi:hypothetical protein
MENVFKEGDRVYLYTLGWGTIKELGVFFIVIKFDIFDDDRHIGGGLIELISFTEYTLEGFSQKRPEELPKKGDIVWGRDRDYQNWHIYHFSHKSEDGLYHLSSDNSRNAYILKQITTINPYTNEQ